VNRTEAVLAFALIVSFTISVLSTDTSVLSVWQNTAPELAQYLLLLIPIGGILYAAYACYHAFFNIESRSRRIGWSLFIAVFFVFGALIYYLTEYQKIRRYKKFT